MKITIEECGPEEEEFALIRCKKLTPATLGLISSLRNDENQIAAMKDDKIVMLEPNELYYVEAVDNRVFLYTQKEVYESRMKLYEAEEQFGENFFRISKSVILNIKKIKSLAPMYNGRFEAQLKNGEKIMISRKYLPGFKERLGL